MLIKIILIIIGFVFLIKGADLLVRAATSLSKKFGLSELIIGLTVVAIGTSLPEIFITIKSSLENHPDLIIGNSIGSSICNILLVMGITSLVKPVKLEKQIIKTQLPTGLFAIFLIFILGNTNKIENIGTITKGQGIILIFFTIVYIIYTIYQEIKMKNKDLDKEIIEEVKSKEDNSIITIIFYTILGILGLKYGAEFVVDNAVSIAKIIGLSEQFIGITIVAIGTSLPEVITGITAARKGETDLLLGNIFGSNMFNLLLLIGIGSSINPLKYTESFNMSILLLILVTLFIHFMVIEKEKKELDKKTGIIFIGIYIVYLICMA